MKKSVSILFFLFFINFFSAWSVNAQFGIRAGLNLSNIVGHNIGNENLNRKTKPGFHIGAVYDLRLSKYFFAQPGILFSTKGYIEKGAPAADNYTFKMTGNYAELPINLIYHPHVGNKDLFFGAGPFIAYGLGGRWTSESTANTKGDVVFVNDYDQYDNAGGKNLVYGKKSDYGINILIGFEFANEISAQLNGQLGLKNITPLKDGQILDVKQNNVQFGLSVGYHF